MVFHTILFRLRIKIRSKIKMAARYPVQNSQARPQKNQKAQSKQNTEQPPPPAPALQPDVSGNWALPKQEKRRKLSEIPLQVFAPLIAILGLEIFLVVVLWGLCIAIIATTKEAEFASVAGCNMGGTFVFWIPAWILAFFAICTKNYRALRCFALCSCCISVLMHIGLLVTNGLYIWKAFSHGGETTAGILFCFILGLDFTLWTLICVGSCAACAIGNKIQDLLGNVEDHFKFRRRPII